MKIKLFVIAILITGFSACTQKTCPTYAKGDVEEKPSTETKVKV